MNNFKYVNVAVCQSNIKSKKGSYFARVCKEGRINGRHLLYEIKKRTSGMDIDVAVIETVMEKMKDVIFDFVSSGYNVDFFNLGTFSLSTAGQLKVKESIAGYAPDEKDILLEINKKDENKKDDAVFSPKVTTRYGDFNITEAVNKNVQFKMKFEPSREIKNDLKNVKIGVAIKKKRAPLIKKISFPIPQTSSTSPSFMKIEGEALKVMGKLSTIGVYIEEKKSGAIKKIPKTAIIQNTPKNLLIMVEGGLKLKCEYNVKIVTQYIEGGISSVLRVGSANFVYECPVMADMNNVTDDIPQKCVRQKHTVCDKSGIRKMRKNKMRKASKCFSQQQYLKYAINA